MPPPAAVPLPPLSSGTRWSDPATWGGTLPPAGSAVVIPAGKTVVLDTQTPPLKGLTIEGTLVAGDTDLGITSDFVYVKGGRLQIGSAQQPFLRTATITLTGSGTADNPGTPGFGNKVLATMGGTLELHGRPVAKSWTRLNADVAAGQRTLMLAEAPGWRVGDQIVVSTSTADQAQYSLGEIEAINGTTVTLRQPVRYSHRGTQQQLAGDLRVDTRAAVGLLSRNIVVQGDANSHNTRVGGHAMFMAGSGSTTLQISGVEFRAMGQFNLLGRYPVHFHLMGRGCSGCYVRDSSVRDSVQRGIVVHDSAVTVESNVVFNTVGHNVVVETETTEGAVINGNLALVNSLPSPLFTDPGLAIQNDRMPSNYWMKSARNAITNNVAAGALDSGFMYDHAPNGPVHFKGNVAYAAMSRGVEDDFPTTGGMMFIFARNGMAEDVMDDMLVYNSATGFWLEIYDEESIGPVHTLKPLTANRVTMMDNGRGFFGRGANNRVTLNDAVFVRNATFNQYGGLQVLNRPVFVEMRTGIGGGHDTAPLDSQLVINQPRLVNSAQFAPDDMSFSVFDDDTLHPRGMYVHGSQPMLATPECVQYTFRDQSKNDAETYFRCPRLYTYTEIDVRDLAAPTARLHQTQDIRRSDGLAFRAFAGPLESSGGLSGYAAYADAGLSYALTAPSAAGHALRLTYTHDEATYTERATIEVAVPVAAPPSGVYRNGTRNEQPDAATPAHALRAAASRAELSANPLTTYFYDSANRQVIVHASRRWVTIRP